MRGGFGAGSQSSSIDRDSLDEAEEMLVLATDHIEDQLEQLDLAARQEAAGCKDPKSLIVTNVDHSVFVDSLAKEDFESRFLAYEADIAFYYIRTFRRVRVDFSCHAVAAKAKAKLDAALVGQNTVHCYWLRVSGPGQGQDSLFLAPPPLEKQFLISPPCSPPVGWEQPREARPNPVDYDLLAAMAQLGPGDNHELQPSKSVTICGRQLTMPSIVVHVCEGAGEALGGERLPGRLLQTRRPPAGSP